MKSVNRVLMIAAMAAMVPLLNSCKKGEDDPFLSLKSRKARVTGEWTIESWVSEASYTSASTSSGSTFNSSGNDNLKIEGSSATLTSTGSITDSWGTSSFSDNGIGSAVATMTFEKDGTFSKKVELKNMNITSVSDGVTTAYTYTVTMETSGTWNFLGGVEEDYKNKERLILNILEEKSTSNYTDSGDTGNSTSTDTYDNGEYTEVWTLTQLKNKEMVMEGTSKTTTVYNNTDTYGGTAYTSTGSSSSTGSMTATLVQK